MPFTTYLDNSLLQNVFGGVAYAPPSTIYVGLSSTPPTATGGNITEPSGNGYARVAIANNTTNFSTPTTGTTSNSAAITFPASTGAWVNSAPLNYFIITDSSTNGNILAFGTVSNPQVVNSSGAVLTFPAGTLSLSLT